MSTLLFGAGSATKGQTGAEIEAGTGALISGLANVHGSWGAMHWSAQVGAGFAPTLDASQILIFTS